MVHTLISDSESQMSGLNNKSHVFELGSEDDLTNATGLIWCDTTNRIWSQSILCLSDTGTCTCIFRIQLLVVYCSFFPSVSSLKPCAHFNCVFFYNYENTRLSLKMEILVTRNSRVQIAPTNIGSYKSGHFI